MGAKQESKARPSGSARDIDTSEGAHQERCAPGMLGEASAIEYNRAGPTVITTFGPIFNPTQNLLRHPPYAKPVLLALSGRVKSINWHLFALDFPCPTRKMAMLGANANDFTVVRAGFRIDTY